MLAGRIKAQESAAPNSKEESMEQREHAKQNGTAKAFAIALVIAAIMALALCGCAGQGGAAKSDIPTEDRTKEFFSKVL